MNPQRASRTKGRSLVTGRRLRLLTLYATTLRVLASYGGFHLLRRLRGPSWAEQALPRVHRRNARRVMRAITRVQGLFVKVGQLVSILSGFLPAVFREQLEGLQDRIPPRPFEEIEERLRAELGASLDTVFAHIDHQALAAASLAQVHLADLPDGRRVAVKVQHQGIERLARLDLAAARRILAVVGFVTRARGLGGLFGEVQGMIEAELDFLREADHIEQIGAHLTALPRVSTPAVIRELSTARVLVTAFVDGVKVTDLRALDARSIDRPELAECLLEAYCQMMFVEGLYHADPHPGNILVKDDGSVVLLDFGAVARVSPAMKAGVPQLAEAVLRRDREETCRALERLGFLERRPGNDVAARLIDYVYTRFLEQVDFDAWKVDELHFDIKMKADMMADMKRLDLSLYDLTDRLQVPREWILLFRTVILLLGVCSEIHPGLRPAEVLRPWLADHVFGGRGWLHIARSVVQDLALAALTLPVDMKRILARAERGDLSVEARGVREGSLLLYALGHQALYTAFVLASGGLAYLAHAHGELSLARVLVAVGGVFLALLGGSIWKARAWHRALRRGTHRR